MDQTESTLMDVDKVYNKYNELYMEAVVCSIFAFIFVYIDMIVAGCAFSPFGFLFFGLSVKLFATGKVSELSNIYDRKNRSIEIAYVLIYTFWYNLTFLIFYAMVIRNRKEWVSPLDAMREFSISMISIAKYVMIDNIVKTVSVISVVAYYFATVISDPILVFIIPCAFGIFVVSIWQSVVLAMVTDMMHEVYGSMSESIEKCTVTVERTIVRNVNYIEVKIFDKLRKIYIISNPSKHNSETVSLVISMVISDILIKIRPTSNVFILHIDADDTLRMFHYDDRNIVIDMHRLIEQ